MNNYLKSYPYLFVRETDQTDYFCTLCDAYLKEEELQAHLFDGHHAEDCNGYFVRVCTERADKGYFTQKKYVYICVVCWGKLANASDMASHRSNCKIQEDKLMRMSSDQEEQQQVVTKVVSTPDIPCYVDVDENSREEEVVVKNGNSSSTPKRGRKKQPHPQKVLPIERLDDVVVQQQQQQQCCLCEAAIPAAEQVKHLQDWHRTSVKLDDLVCPLCNASVPLLELNHHLTSVHVVNASAAAAGNSTLLLLLLLGGGKKSNNEEETNGNNSNNDDAAQSNNNNNNNVQRRSRPEPNLNPSSLPMILQSMLPPMPSLEAKSGAIIPSPSSFLQSLLNGNNNPSTSNSNNFKPNNVENVVAKLTRRHVGMNARESYQCQVCSKWFAVPPIKHLRGHLVTCKEEQRLSVPLISGGHACLVCYAVHDTTEAITSHLASQHPMPLGSTSHNNETANNKLNNDPKGVELDNAGRVKSGKVRKQCELCGQWSNIKWFFKHMSEVHRALFCRCCREYLPIHEQEEHRKWHSEPPYMGQKIRIENGQPIIIDRKERASLTPIGSLASWGGSSGGMVVKAVDDSLVSPVSHVASKKRKLNNTSEMKVTNNANGGNNFNNGKDTLMPKETCPVCGIQITYKNLARHIKLRHKIKYKFCHKCRKFVPNDTYEDHKVTCNPIICDVIGDLHQPTLGTAADQEEVENESEAIDASEYLDLNSASALVVTPPSANDQEEEDEEDVDNDDDESNDLMMDEDDYELKKNESFRTNTSKTKLESLMGKEFKHPRRRCAICGYTVSYSNFKRHLRNAHPKEFHEYEKDPSDWSSLSHEMDTNEEYLVGHQMDESDEANNKKEDYEECKVCGDRILKDFLERHLKMNHPNEAEKKQQMMRDCPVCQVQMRPESVVKHCKVKHKISYKYCSPCEKYVLKKAYKQHANSNEHNNTKGLDVKEDQLVNKSSGEDDDEDEDLPDEEGQEESVQNNDK